jgi:hypothetical protein
MPGLEEALSARLPPSEPPEGRLEHPDRLYRVEPSATGARWDVFRGPRRPVASTGPDEAAELVVSDFERHLARRSEGLVFVHAGAVARDGRAILLPGRSFAGKSALVAALLEDGAEYLSDEFAVVDAGGRVHPYARPLGLRRADGRVERVRPEALGARVSGPVPAGLVAFLRYRRDACFEIVAATPGEALLPLLVNTLEVLRRIETASAVLRSVVTTAPAVRGVRGEAREAARRLAELAREAVPLRAQAGRTAPTSVPG